MRFQNFLAGRFKGLRISGSADVEHRSSIGKHVTALQAHSHTAINDNKPHFRFLDLPFEIRIHIYSYLVPNGIVMDYGLNHNGTPERSSAQILRLNRQVYTEALEELYGRAVYQAEIGIHGFCIHGRRYTLHYFPPYTFHYIHKLDLRLRLTVPCLYNPGKTILGLYDCTKWLVGCFPPGKQRGKEGKLRSLKLNLEIAHDFISFYAGEPEELARDLVIGLKPLWDLKGLRRVSVITQRQPDALRRAQDTTETGVMNEVVDGVEEFGRRLAKRIGPSPSFSPDMV